MSEIKLGTSTIATYQGSSKRGMMLNHRYVHKMYLGNTLVWEDSDAPTLSEISENQVIWMAEDLFPNNYKFTSLHTETSPWPTAGGTSDKYDLDYSLRLLCNYSDGTALRFWENADNNSKYFVGTLYLNDVAQDKYVSIGTDYSKYTIPENTKPYGVLHTIYKKSLSGDNGKKTFIDVQTSDEHALFGLSSDSYNDLDFGSTAKDWLTKSNGTYTVTTSAGNAKVLIFRPLKNCQLNLKDTEGYYCEVDGTLGGNIMVEVYNKLETNISSSEELKLPNTADDLKDTGKFPSDFFKDLPSSLQLKKGTAVVVGFFDGNGFDFSEPFYINTTSININGAANSTATIYLTTESSVAWTASTADSWLTVNNTSGTGSATIKLTAAQNTTGLTRYTKVTFTNTNSNKTCQAIVSQPAYSSPGLTFTNVPAPWSVSTNSTDNNTWYVDDNGDLQAGSTEYVTFTANKSGTVTLGSEAIAISESCNPVILGATISTQNSYFDSSNAIAICDSGMSENYSVTSGTTYYIQIKKDSSITDSVSINLTVSFK